jgi:peptidoglycan/xylan/chitin deacetylase (PgdA/CDA1 family)
MLMYHSVSDDDQWLFGHLSCPVRTFESHLEWLKRKRYQSVTLQQIYESHRGREALPDKPAVLTFDDGFLDNWTFVYPLLRKYGFTGTIFVSPEFVDPSRELRPTLDEVWNGDVKMRDLPTLGYLSWREMEEMEKNGVMDIQSHTMTHTWHFTKDEIVDFHRPGGPYPWLIWNRYPERKYAWLSENQEELLDFGAPIYRYDRALQGTRYFEDEGVEKALIEFVRSEGGREFFKRSTWRETLRATASDALRSSGSIGRFETAGEYRDRLVFELGESKRTIEENLKKQVKFVCWPGGAYTLEAEQVAKDLGYYAAVVNPKNLFEKHKIEILERVYPPTIQVPEGNRVRIHYRGGYLLTHTLRAQEGSVLSKLVLKASKIPYKLKLKHV